MAEQTMSLDERIRSNKSILLAEIAPPASSDPAAVREIVRPFSGRVHAVGVSDNRNYVGMSALAAASLVLAEGIEPILHVVTRDRNRIALVSDFLGAQALGIRNLFCTSGTHQSLRRFRAAKGVFDLDSIQLLQTYSNLARDGHLVGEASFEGVGSMCLGAAAAPYAEPRQLQGMRLAKKALAGAQFLITDPVFDRPLFEAWWQELTHRGLQEQVAILAGVRVLTGAEQARAYAASRPDPMVPVPVIERLAAVTGAQAQRQTGIQIARETLDWLSKIKGLRGVQLSCEEGVEVVLDLLEQAGLEAKH